MGYSVAEFAQLGAVRQAPGRPRLPLHGVHELLGQAGAEGRRGGGATFPPGCRSASSRTPCTRSSAPIPPDELGAAHRRAGRHVPQRRRAARVRAARSARDVIRPAIAGLMGAYGAALYAMRSDKSHALGHRGAGSIFTHTSKTGGLRAAVQNHCRLTINSFADGERIHLRQPAASAALGIGKADRGAAEPLCVEARTACGIAREPRRARGKHRSAAWRSGCTSLRRCGTRSSRSLGFEVVMSGLSDRARPTRRGSSRSRPTPPATRQKSCTGISSNCLQRASIRFSIPA